MSERGIPQYSIDSSESWNAPGHLCGSLLAHFLIQLATVEIIGRFRGRNTKLCVAVVMTTLPFSGMRSRRPDNGRVVITTATHSFVFLPRNRQIISTVASWIKKCANKLPQRWPGAFQDSLLSILYWGMSHVQPIRPPMQPQMAPCLESGSRVGGLPRKKHNQEENLQGPDRYSCPLEGQIFTQKKSLSEDILGLTLRDRDFSK